MDRIDPRAMTLCGMPREASSMEVAYPRGATDAHGAAGDERGGGDGDEARRARRRGCIDRGAVVDAAFLSPVSNFPLYYFVFRLISSRPHGGGGEGGDGALGTRARNARRRRRAIAIAGREILEIGASRACARLDARDGVDVDGAACCRLADPRSRNSSRTKDRTRCSCRATPWPRPRRRHQDSKEKCAAARVRRIFNETGVVELRKHRRDTREIYGRGAPAASTSNH